MTQMLAAQDKKPVHSTPASAGRVLQRTCDICGQKDDWTERGVLQRSARRDGPELVPQVVHDVLRGPGRPLDAKTRAFFEPRFGHDFSSVRVHTDAKAAESARAVNALAYTTGRSIVFGDGQFNPLTGPGRRILAHELTHVVQQRGIAGVPAPYPVTLHNNDREESEAHSSADSLSSSSAPVRVRPIGHLRAVIQREQATQQQGSSGGGTGGRPVNFAEWMEIHPLLRRAINMARDAASRLGTWNQVLNSNTEPDPRSLSREQQQTVELFTAHFKETGIGNSMTIEGNYRRIADSLDALGQESFWRVPDQAADPEGTQVSAYTIGRAPVIYCLDSFFLTRLPSDTSLRMAPAPEIQQRVLLHEGAHFSLGVFHSGGVFSISTPDCSHGHPVRSFNQAQRNAYVYDLFARCCWRGL